MIIKQELINITGIDKVLFVIFLYILHFGRSVDIFAEEK